MHLVNYRKNQDMLMETPASALADFTPATANARLRRGKRRSATGNTILSEPEAKAMLTAYGIPTVETHIARTPAEASRLAGEMGGSVALKILVLRHRPQIRRRRRDAQSARPLRSRKGRQCDVGQKVARRTPDAQILGFTVQTMARRPGAQEIIIGVTTDPIFGPVIMFGQGGIAVEVIGDLAIGLPPLK